MLSIVIFEKELWGKGIATEVTKVFVKEVFNKFDIEKIGAFTYSNNYRSIGLLEKVGFIKIEHFLKMELNQYILKYRIKEGRGTKSI